MKKQKTHNTKYIEMLPNKLQINNPPKLPRSVTIKNLEIDEISINISQTSFSQNIRIDTPKQQPKQITPKQVREPLPCDIDEIRKSLSQQFFDSSDSEGNI